MAANQSAPSSEPPRSEPPISAAKRDYYVLRRLLIALLVVACAGPLSLNLVDPDLWGHVRYAQEWIADGALPRTATHTYTAVGHPWVNHENLAELLLARGFHVLGVPGMLAAKVALGVGVLLMMWLAARRQGVRPIAAWVFFLLVAYNLQAFFPMRPQLLSFLWCAVMLLCLDRAFAEWGGRKADFQQRRRKADPNSIHWRWLLPLPLLFAVWANSHGGFVAGYAILAAVLIGKCAELYWRAGSEATRLAAPLAAIAAATGLATLANPYGFDLHRWLLESLGTARPEITEWGPPLPGSPVFWPFLVLALVAALTLTFSDRRRDPTQVVVLVLVGWQAASHLRHIAFFALLCGFWLPPHVQSVAARVRGRAAAGLPVTTLSPWALRGFAAALAVAIGLQSVYLGQRIASLPVYRSHYPVDAVQWMADSRVEGKLVVCFNWAQYALAALAPDVRVAFDGRFRTCYPQRVIDSHFDFLVGERHPRNRSPESGPIDGAHVLSDGDPDFVLVDRKYLEPAEVMRAASESGEWTLVYQDAVAQVWGRADRVDDPESPHHVPEARRLVSDHRSATSVEWPALPLQRAAADAFGELDAVASRERAPESSDPSNEG